MKSGVPKDIDKVSFPLKPDGDWGEKWDDIIAKAEPIKEVAERKPEEMATIIYTSGSTGQPKGAMLSFKNMTVPTQGIIKLFNINSKDRYLSYLPLSHGEFIFVLLELSITLVIIFNFNLFIKIILSFDNHFQYKRNGSLVG